MNHRFTPELAVTRPLWIDQHLKGGFKFPKTTESKLLLATDDGVPVLQVTPDSSRPVEKVHILYSVDPDPQARFWRSAEATKKGDIWFAKLPIFSVEEPLFAFANVHYRIGQARAGCRSPLPTKTFAISSLLHTAAPKELRAAGVKATDKPSLLIDDFTHGWRDWYTLSAANRHHWEFSTRKINDPKWRGQQGYQLTFDVQSEKPNWLWY